MRTSTEIKHAGLQSKSGYVKNASSVNKKTASELYKSEEKFHLEAARQQAYSDMNHFG